MSDRKLDAGTLRALIDEAQERCYYALEIGRAGWSDALDWLQAKLNALPPDLTVEDNDKLRTLVNALEAALREIIALDLSKDETGRDDFYSGPGRFFRAHAIAREALSEATVQPVLGALLMEQAAPAIPPDLAERDNQLINRQQQLLEANNQLITRNNELAERTQERDEFDAKLRAVEDAIAEVCPAWFDAEDYADAIRRVGRERDALAKKVRELSEPS